MPPYEENWTDPLGTEKNENQLKLRENGVPAKQQTSSHLQIIGRIKYYNEEGQKIQNTEMEEKEGEEGLAVSLCDRLMLVSSLFSIEMCMSFQQLYEILFLQFLGVPVALVSVNGIIAGTSGMVILPLIGSWADRGSNSKKRKMIAMSAGLVVFVAGLILLVIASVVKIHRLNDVLGNRHGNTANLSNLMMPNDHANSSHSLYLFHTLNSRLDDSYNVTFVDHGDFNDTENEKDSFPPIETGDRDNTPVGVIIISILGFTGLDMGFDLTIALSRASILDIVPKFQHKQVLVLATIVQSVAGFVCATIGCFDMPTILGSLFSTDGSAATLIFFCCVLLMTSFASFSLMGFANYRLGRKEKEWTISKFGENLSEYSRNNRKESIIQAVFEQLEEKGSLCINGQASTLEHLQDNQVFSSNSLGVGSTNGYKTKTPLLLDSLKTNYLTINQDVQQSGNFSELGALPNGSSTKKPKTNDLNANLHLENYEDENLQGQNGKEHIRKVSVSVGFPSEEHQSPEEEDPTAVLEAISQPSTVAMTPLEALNVANAVETEDTITTTAEMEDFPKLGSSDWEQRYRKMKLKLLILWVSSFFSVGSSLTFSLYSFNALNIGILNGDPTALPGSEGRRHYENGLRLGSFGNMVFYSAFLLISLTNTRVIRVLGEKNQFVINHVILIVSLVAVMTSQRVDVFMVYMGACGLFRPCMLTLPYVMAHQFAQEGMPAEHEESGQKKSHTGRVMTLIGFLVPSHYCLLSIFMGPLIEATGNPWVPLFYCLGTCSVSLGVFSLLFFV